MQSHHPITQRRAATSGFLISVILTTTVCLMIYGSPPDMHVLPLVAFLVLGLLVTQSWTIQVMLKVPRDPVTPELIMPYGVVSPWALQRRLMHLSQQPMPKQPIVTSNSILYAALIMEEAGETFAALESVLPDQGGDFDLDLIKIQLNNVSSLLASRSLMIRHLVEGHDYHIALTEEMATELLDGTTDIAVVNCGFAIACGLPAEEGYESVVYSNLSKANPDTGMIDKTPDGKWIKGELYSKPNLVQVLRQQQQQVAG